MSPREAGRARWIELLVLVLFVAAIALLGARVWDELTAPTPAEEAAESVLPECEPGKEGVSAELSAALPSEPVLRAERPCRSR